VAFPSGARSAEEQGIVVVGVDLAVSLKATGDETAISVVLVHPDETRELLALEAGRWEGPSIVERIAHVARRHNARTVVVEGNAAQRYLAQYLQRQYIPVESFITGVGQQSLLYAVEMLGVELARNQWIIPSTSDGRPRHPEVHQLVREMLAYSPSSHCGDRLASFLFASHAAREWAPARVPLSLPRRWRIP